MPEHLHLKLNLKNSLQCNLQAWTKPKELYIEILIFGGINTF